MAVMVEQETTDGRYLRLSDGSWWDQTGIDIVDESVPSAYLAANPRVGVVVRYFEVDADGRRVDA